MSTKNFLLTLCLFTICVANAQIKTAKHIKSKQNYNAYLFVYFTGNGNEQEAIRFAISKDGLNYYALNNSEPVLSSKKISSTGGVRDPHILRGQDGKTFYMVATDMVASNGWDSNRAMVLLKSNDLINWTSTIVNIQKKFPGQDSLLRVWAPQTIYDEKAGKYMIYWAMKYGKEPDKIYYAYANKDFTDLETAPKQLLFTPDNGAAIDGDILQKDGKNYLFFKTENAKVAGIKVAVSDSLTGTYKVGDSYVQQTTNPVEGGGTFKLNDGSGYILMYDVYTKGRYQFTKSKDLNHFTVIDDNVSMNFHPRHGTVMPITTAEVERLAAKWLSTDDVVRTTSNPAIKKININLDTAAQMLTLPVGLGTNLAKFDPLFVQFPGVNISPKGPQDFTRGAVNYNLQIAGGKAKTYQVRVVVNNNPLFGGLYADPEVLYSHKTNKYYVYPTSDGFNNWSGSYFKIFSSPDLVQWKDEGVILNLVKDVSWAKSNAWAPTIIEKKINGQYKYFYYFCAAQKVGVAVADDPAGPFVDSGKPLLSKRPTGVHGGQEIDPDVFEDPVSGKDYLYWGNGYMAVAELNKDMISIDTTTTKVITPDETFREGTEVAYRKGKYYFMWSEDDTRSPNYKVRYGYADSPTGKIIIPGNNIVIEKDTVQGIYATGHNSVLNIPGTHDWYIIYHRFNRPDGIKMGEAAGYNREVCIDKLFFNKDGTIQEVKPTLQGVTKPQLPQAKN
ncbi:family 43 glycosylhydrolase [Mucilaginibacter pocheonensis]|uniref:Sucrose-6-phosphate hydrolase SacC (GH32 family) n=1 Tax=Mucilaginibacter pocheonensis TaxID=398050 RepID=A0ABU1TIY8_9SPHI|nr:family 43 glycosylhydrolase [Mucilaginibacter pocheonensis]MDR6944761.1 sucrose-6-phosphate hydrolase SacC (GH32 family) [Mucilaginibacter pocheonensis]